MNTISILEKLVAFDTTSRLSNIELISFIADYLANFDIASELFFNEDRRKANIVARVGNGSDRGIILSGHTDVVPVDGQNWSTDPFKLTVRDGSAFGRGTCDMKGFIACALAAVPNILAARLPVPVYLVFSYDEEVGCVGIRDVLADLPILQDDIRACIVGEPTSMKPVTAHTGKQVVSLKFRGTPMHSSLSPKGVNAISFAGKVIVGICDLAEEVTAHKVSDNRFEFPHPTVNIGRISGGKAVNIVAEECEFEVECRFPPGSSADGFRQGLEKIVHETATLPMRRLHPNAQVTLSDIISYPAFAADPDSHAADFVQRITGSNSHLAVNYGTEAGLFQENGISTVVCGPGDIAQAHQPDEYISLNQLQACDRFLSRMVSVLSAEAVS